MLPAGKLPSELLRALLLEHTPSDPRVLLGPGIGLDCAVLDVGDRLLVAKSDPITFTADEIGWYAVNVNANDIATTGAQPLWFLATILLPEGRADEALAQAIFHQIRTACQEIDVQLIGGHTEITLGLDRPILAGTMLGEVSREQLVTPYGARPGDRLLLTKGVPIEASSILAREYASHLSDLAPAVVDRARNYLHQPGISVVPEARIAVSVGGVTAMHDPTEGGLAAGLWELSQAAGIGLDIDLSAIPIPEDGKQICEALEVDPLQAIASGALLITADVDHAAEMCEEIQKAGILVADIGSVTDAASATLRTTFGPTQLTNPARDALAELAERLPHQD